MVTSSTFIGYFNSEDLQIRPERALEGLGGQSRSILLPAKLFSFFSFKSSLARAIPKVTQSQQPFCGSVVVKG